jgi:hypothetical protein
MANISNCTKLKTSENKMNRFSAGTLNFPSFLEIS